MRPSPSGASPPCCTGSRCRAASSARPQSSHRPQCRSGLGGATDGPMAVGRTPDEFRASGDLTVALQDVAVRATATTCDRRPASRSRTCRASSSNSRATAEARSCRGAGRRAIVINPVTPWTAGAISGLAIFAPAADLLTRLSASNSRPDGSEVCCVARVTRGQWPYVAASQEGPPRSGRPAVVHCDLS